MLLMYYEEYRRRLISNARLFLNIVIVSQSSTKMLRNTELSEVEQLNSLAFYLYVPVTPLFYIILTKRRKFLSYGAWAFLQQILGG